MHKVYPVIVTAFLIIAVQGCSKKNHPSPAVVHTDNSTVVHTDVNTDTSIAVKRIDSLIVTKPAVKRKPKETIPKVIVVNDKYANKSVDGRYYYDLQGHRYWRNNRDGKYYLFNKSMLTDDAFKKPN